MRFREVANMLKATELVSSGTATQPLTALTTLCNYLLVYCPSPLPECKPPNVCLFTARSPVRSSGPGT